MIFVGDGVETDIANFVINVFLQLKNFFASGAGAIYMLLVPSDQTHVFDFWSNIGVTASAGNDILTDTATQRGLQECSSYPRRMVVTQTTPSGNSTSLFVSVLARSDALFRDAFEAVVAGCARE